MRVVKACLLLALSLLALPFPAPTVRGDGRLFPSFTFAAAGDHDSTTKFRASLDALNSSGASFYLAIGDLAYSSIEQSWCQEWLTGSGNPSGKSFKNIILLSGNHDSGEDPSGNINLYTQYCGLGPLGPSAFTSSINQTTPQNGCVWPDASRKCYAKEFYFDWPLTNPMARFIMISPAIDYNVDNGEKWVYDKSMGNARYNFVKNAIDTARLQGISWIIAGLHKPYLETDSSHIAEIGSDIFNLLIQEKVDLILQAHVHNYERTNQLALSSYCQSITTSYNPACVASSGSKFYKDKGTIVALAGTFGRTHSLISVTEPGTPYFQALNDTTWGFLKVTVSELRLDAQFVPTSGTFTDKFTILSTGAAAFLFDWGDFNNDGRVDIVDIGAAVLFFGQVCVNPQLSPRQCYWDFDKNRMVDIMDVASVALQYGLVQPDPYLGQGQNEYALDRIFTTP